MAWLHRFGDGHEEVLQHEKVESCYISLKAVRTLDHVRTQLAIHGDKGFITKKDLVDLAYRLLSHVSNLESRADDRRRRGAEVAAHRAAAVVVASARAAADAYAQARAVPDKVVIAFGTRWGKWTYVLDERLGPSVRHDFGYLIDLARVEAPDSVGDWLNHLLHKNYLSADDLGDAAKALVTCLAFGEAPADWKPIDTDQSTPPGSTSNEDPGGPPVLDNCDPDPEDIPF